MYLVCWISYFYNIQDVILVANKWHLENIRHNHVMLILLYVLLTACMLLFNIRGYLIIKFILIFYKVFIQKY